jgi:hypothetical protein
MQGSIFKHALALCRRIFLFLFLLLLLGITVLGAWFYWQAPNMDALRPHIASYLEQQLQLQHVRLGELSWQWAGFLWVQADRLDFSSKDEELSYRGGRVAVRLPISSLLSGSINPDQIRLSGGTMNIHFSGSAAVPVPAEQLILDDIDLHWHFAGWQGQLPGMHLNLDGTTLSLQATSSALQMSAQLDQDGLLKHMKLHCNHIEWLPESLVKYIRGAPVVDIELQRTAQQQWRIKATMASEKIITLMPADVQAFSLNQLDSEFLVTTKKEAVFEPQKVEIQHLNWSLADNAISATGSWQDGTLQLQAQADHLAMPVIWSWLHRLDDDDEWRHWLTLMHSGTASQATARLSLSWPEPWQAWPEAQAWSEMQYHVDAEVLDADIAFGTSEDFLLHTKAHVKINQDGLNAHIQDAELPRALGQTTGDLYMPWETLDLHISGSSKANMMSLMQWFGPDQIADWQWNKAISDTTFQLLWDLSEEKPRQASAELRPYGVWDISINDIPLKVSQGTIRWNQASGIELSNVHINNGRMQGTLSLSTTPDVQGKWQISSLDGQGTADFSKLAANYQLPLSNAKGAISTSLHYDGQWSGSVDLTAASWDHLLGSSKTIGDAFVISYQGELELDKTKPTVYLSKLKTAGNALQLKDGSASINRDELKVTLVNLYTPAFDGSMDIVVPFGDSPWEVETQARYLNRRALPKALDHPEQLINKPWILRARINQFDWDDARMSGVHMRMASTKGSIGIFEAALIHTMQMDMQNVSARFSLPGNGQVDLRHFSAHIEKQQLTMSATLVPEKGGGMRWRGFAELTGDFGHLMKQGRLSEKFTGGEGHVLFSGQGIILREQPWWQGLDGRLRLRVDEGRILEGGTLTTFLAATSLTDLPGLLIGKRKDLTGPGIMFKRLQIEAIMQNQDIHIRNIAMRSAAFDMIGHGDMDINKDMIDLYLIARPLQNLDALLAKIPLLRDILGGKSHSFMRKVYHMYGPFTDAKVEAVTTKEAGLASPGIIENLLSLPDNWFGAEESTEEAVEALPSE